MTRPRGSSTRERELKDLQDRLAAAEKRAHEAKVSAQAFKADLDRHRRALQKEVGDDANVNKLLEDSSGAKGRAQQIFQLKEQVKALTKRLSEGGGGGGPGGAADELGPPTPDGADERQRGALNAIEADRRREHERSLLREQELSAELVETRKRADAMAARIRNLEADIKGKKDKLRTMIEKSDGDDALVSALRAELDKHRTKAGGGRGAGGGAVVGMAPSATEERRAGEMAARMAQQQSQIDRQEQIINALREQLQTQQVAAADHSFGTGSRPGSARAKQPQDFIVLQTENAKLRELVALLQDKLAAAEQEDY